MTTWGEFAREAPELASEGRALLRRGDVDEALLATVRADESPRVHPVWVKIVDDRLYAFILRSPKRVDLERDGRYALHSHQDPAAPSEFSVRGLARLVPDPVRSVVAAEWYFEVDESYALFEFSITTATLGLRTGPDEWPPRYRSWTAARIAARHATPTSIAASVTEA